MDVEALKGMLKRRPFVPFRLHVSGDVVYEIRNPELVRIGGAALFIGIARDVNSDLWDEPVIVANRHIIRMEPIIEADAAAVS